MFLGETEQQRFDRAVNGSENYWTYKILIDYGTDVYLEELAHWDYKDGVLTVDCENLEKPYKSLTLIDDENFTIATTKDPNYRMKITRPKPNKSKQYSITRCVSNCPYPGRCGGYHFEPEA